MAASEDSAIDDTSAGAFSAFRIRRIAEAVVLSFIPGALAIRQAGGIEPFVRDVIFQWFVENFVAPLVDGFLGTGALIIEGVLTLFFGDDLAVGGSTYGLADIWLLVAEQLASAGAGPLSSLIGLAEDINQSIAELAATAGPAAPAVVAGMYLILVGGSLWILWSVVRVIDVPLIDLDSIVRVLFAPARFILRRVT